MKRYIRSATMSNKKLAKTSNDPKVLARLANDADEAVRWFVARNPNLPADILEQLANDADEDVRCSVAKHPNTSVDVLAQLANDKNKEVREQVATNPNTPADILEQLANDADEAVRWFVARNPNLPADILEQLANDADEDVRCYVAEHPNTPAEILAQLANDEDMGVREAAMDNPNCPVKSNKSKKWPSADEWYNIDSNDEFSDMWDRYLAGPEDGVNKQLQIFPEPSIQGGMGGMFIFDESDSENESIYVDFQDWCNQELNMAAESKSAKAYATKYKAFVENLISENWR